MERKWWTLTAVSAGMFMLLLDITIVNVALPDIQRQLGGSLSDLQWVIDAYALSLAALLLTAGSVADLLGRRVVFAIGIAVFSAGSLLCGLAQSPVFLSLARAGQGIGGSIMFATSLALLAHSFRGRDRGVAFGVWGAIAGIAVAVGPVVGGALVSGLSWRWIFLVNVPIGAVTLAITLLRVEESSNPSAQHPDWPGLATFSTALLALVYGLIKSSSDGWGSHLVIGSAATGAGLLLAFVLIELRSRNAMLDMSLLRVPTFVGGLTSAFAISASLFSVLTFIVIYLQNVLGFSAIGTGLRLLALTGAIFVTSGIAGRLSAHVPTRLLIGPGFALVGLGILLMRGITPTTSWTHLLPGMIVAGVGAGLVNVPLASTAVGVVDPSRSGMASGVNSTLRQVGIAAGIAALGSILATQGRSGVLSSLGAGPLGHRVAEAVASGQASHAIAGAPPAIRARVAAASLHAFTSSLDGVLLIAGIVALAGALLALTLIRQRDFVEAPDGAEGELVPAAA
jgi:EmrB/QacA subfamily drug resistance transporter